MPTVGEVKPRWESLGGAGAGQGAVHRARIAHRAHSRGWLSGGGGLDNASTASPRMQIIAYMATRNARIVRQIEREGDLSFRVDPLGAWFILRCCMKLIEIWL